MLGNCFATLGRRFSFLGNGFPFVGIHFPFLGNWFPFIASHFPFLGNWFPSIASHFPFIGNWFPSIASHFPFIGSHLPFLGNWFPFIGSHFPFLGNWSPFIGNQFPSEGAWSWPCVARWEPGGVVSPVLSFEEARARLLASVPRLPAERVGIDDACGRVLAEAVIAPADLPGFDYSAMDGYAVRAADWPESGAVRLPVVGESRAGAVPSPLVTGSTCRIFTGAAVPAGADAVVMQEKVERQGETALFREQPREGAHIRRRGEDLAQGAVALAPGERLRPAHLALAASCDRAWLHVARRPVVNLIGTGDELRPPGSSPLPGLIPESNGVALRAIATQAGAIARVLPFTRDDRSAMARAFEGALGASDLVVTIGGASVGDADLVRPVLEQLGVAIDFWKVAIKPGKPMLVGRRGDTVVLGVPGNPAAAMVTFALFGVPLLRAMQGDTRAVPPPMRARLAADVAHSPGRLEFIRVTLRRDADGLVAVPLASQASGSATSVAGADGLACIESLRGTVLAGEALDVLWLDELGA